MTTTDIQRLNAAADALVARVKKDHTDACPCGKEIAATAALLRAVGEDIKAGVNPMITTAVALMLATAILGERHDD